jgi:[ribosomal protein S18]-alanine N-acetyltransferase
MRKRGELLVRFGRASDVEAILTLERATEFAPHWAAAAYASALGEEGRRCLMVAEVAGVLAGFAVGVVQPGDACELESVVVAESARRHGVGRHLCAGVLDWMREQGAAAALLEVRSASAGAVALYRELGFAVVGCRRNYYADPADDAVVMQLRLG